MIQNVVIGKPVVEPWELLACDEEDWESNEKAITLFTEERKLATLLVMLGFAPSISEVRRNKPQYCVELTKTDFREVKWVKKRLYIVVGE